MLFLLDADFDRITWYGRGPEDTYADRMHGKLGLYTGTASDSMARYLLPQESGWHQGFFWARITDRTGRGLYMKPGRAGDRDLDDTMGFSLLPWTPEEVDCAGHRHELPQVQHTCLRIGRQMGVGGDDTWGALVHPEYCLDNTKEMRIVFTMRGI